MKEFNLEEAKAGKTVCTREGKPARIIYWDMRGEFPIAAIICGENSDYVLAFTEQGRHYPTKKDYNDLMMASEKKEGWINLYKKDNVVYPSITLFTTKDEAYSIGRVSQYYLTTIKIEWEE